VRRPGSTRDQELEPELLALEDELRMAQQRYQQLRSRKVVRLGLALAAQRSRLLALGRELRARRGGR
jgi:hypothetical protein